MKNDSAFQSFVAFRMLQTTMIDAVVPLIFSNFASRLDGRAIEFLNLSRFVGIALSHLIETTVHAFSALNCIYFTFGSMSILALAGYPLSFFGARNLTS